MESKSFNAKISNMGRKRIVNVPNKNKHFKSGDKVQVKKLSDTRGSDEQ